MSSHQAFPQPCPDGAGDLSCHLHDLANSAAGISGLLMLLRSDGYDGALVEHACQAASGLVEEIARLRSILRTDRRSLAAELAPVAVVALLEAARRETIGLTAVVGCRVEWAPVPALVVQADAGLVHRALINLIKNATEACVHDGIVRVAARLEDRHCRLVVWHPGRFDHRPVPQDGTISTSRGLGLHSVRRIVEMHRDAALGWSSTPDAGTSFWLDLPLAGQ